MSRGTDSTAEELRSSIQREVRQEVYKQVEELNKASSLNAKVRHAGQAALVARLLPHAAVCACLQKMYPPTKTLSEARRLRILVTGGAGFVGSHLVDRLMEQVRVCAVGARPGCVACVWVCTSGGRGGA